MTQFTPPPVPGEVEAFIGLVVTDLSAAVSGAERYREKHERRLSAMGLTGVMANAFSVNTELSVLTMARAALGDARASKSTSAATAAIPS